MHGFGIIRARKPLQITWLLLSQKPQTSANKIHGSGLIGAQKHWKIHGFGFQKVTDSHVKLIKALKNIRKMVLASSEPKTLEFGKLHGFGFIGCQYWLYQLPVGFGFTADS